MWKLPDADLSLETISLYASACAAEHAASEHAASAAEIGSVGVNVGSTFCLSAGTFSSQEDVSLEIPEPTT